MVPMSLSKTNGLRTVDGCRAQHIMGRHATGARGPYFPVIAEALQLTVAAHGAARALLDYEVSGSLAGGGMGVVCKFPRPSARYFTELLDPAG